MRSIRDYIDPGGKILAGRLDQLCSTLENLSVRLRDTIAQAIGESLGGFLRDTASRLLNDLALRLPAPLPRRLPPGTHDSWPPHQHQPDERSYWDDEDEWEQAIDDQEGFEESSDVPKEPDRLATALAAGLQAASWWLRRYSAPPLILTTVAIGAAAGGVAFIGGPLAGALLGVAGSATQFSFFAEVVTAGARLFGLVDRRW